MKEKAFTSNATAKPAFMNDEEKKGDVNRNLVLISVDVPSKSGESSAALTATSGPSAGSGSNTLVGPSATKSKDLEHAVYFE